MDIKPIKNTYKPLHMWLWNEKLNTDYIREHIGVISSSGFGGFCINAQSGLDSKYMGSAWMRNIGVAISCAQERGLDVWICDENGEPSGCGNGSVVSAGLEYQHKILRCEPGEKSNDRTIITKNGYHFYYDVAPYYADPLNKDVTKLFIENTYEEYIKNFPTGICGFLTKGFFFYQQDIPWSFNLPAAYKDAYGEELLDVLEELFKPVGNYKETRIKFQALISKLYYENYLSPIAKWCDSNDMKFIAMLHETREDALRPSIMMQYECADIPCIDVETAASCNAVNSLMASSVAEQFGKSGSMAILLTKSGNRSDFDEMKRCALLQIVRGITKISPAYESSSLRGLRKRRSPTISYIRKDLEKEYAGLNEYVSRISQIMAQGKAVCSTLLLHNLTSLWTAGGTDFCNNFAEIREALDSSVSELEKKHIPFHFGDELLLSKHGYVEGNHLCLGNQKYDTIVIPENAELLESTTRLLSEFEHGGGFVAQSSSLPACEVCDNEKLLYSARSYPDCTVHCFVNNSDDEFTSAIEAGSLIFDAESGEISAFHGVYKFAPYEGIIVIDDNSPELPRPFKKPLKTLNLGGEWLLQDNTDNVLVLDKCDVCFDGELICSDENVIDVTELAYSLKKPVSVECRFTFHVSAIPDKIFLVCERAQDFSIVLNGEKIETDFGTDKYFIDKEFPMLNIRELLSEGENTISIQAEISPDDEFLNKHAKASDSESELSRISYDLEFEPLYIVGDFSVKTDGDFRKLDKNAYRYIGGFSIDRKRSLYDVSNLEQQGFPFFVGSLTFTKTINLSDTQYCIKVRPKGCISAVFEINGEKADSLIRNPYVLDISSLLKKGDNEIRLTLKNNMRNLFGPHHLPIGEIFSVDAGVYYNHPCIWNRNKETPWESNYCFTEFGIDELD